MSRLSPAARLLALGQGYVVAALGGLALLALTFGARLGGDFVWDDVPLVANNRSLVEPGGLWVLLTRDLWGSAGQASTELYHPLPMATFWLQLGLHGLSLPWLRLGNVLLHGGVALLLLAVLRRLRLGRVSSLLACLVFLLHPLVTEPVMWLTGRHDTLAALFSLAALLAYPEPGAGRAGWRLLACSLGCAAAFASKEPYVVTPALVAGLSLVERAPGPGLSRLIRSWLGPVLAVLCVVLLRRALGIPTGSEQLGAAPSEHALVYAAIVQHYATLAFGLSQGPTIASFKPISGALAGACLVAAFAVLAALWRVRDSVAGRVALLGVGWFLVALAPHVLSLPILRLWGNRYGYFPLLGLTLLLAAGLSLSEARGGLVRAAARLAAVGSALLALLLTRQAAANFHDDLSLYRASVDADPADGRALYHLAHAVRTRQGCAGAVELLARAVELEPRYARAQRNLAGCWLNLGQPARAVGPAERAVALEPRVASHRYNLGAALVYSGQRERGKKQLVRALELDPSHTGARRLLSLVKEQ